MSADGGGLPLSLALADFINYMKYRKGASKTTLDTYHNNLLDFLNVVGNIDVSEIDVKTVDKYAVALSFRDYKPKTYRNKMVIIKCLVSYLYKYDKCYLKPEHIEIPKEKHVEANFLDVPEQKQLLSVIKDVRDRALVLVLMTSGVRVSELTDLRYGDMYQRSLIVRQGKGGKPRVTFITQEAEEAVKLYVSNIRGNQPGYLFPNPYGEALSRAIVARKVKYYGELANLEKPITTHTLRHTMATSMLRKGARVEDVQQLLGHANIRNTMTYLHFTNADLQRSYDKVMSSKA